MLDNVGFVENKMSLRTWAMSPCCASIAIFVLRAGQLHHGFTSDPISPVSNTLCELVLLFLLLFLVLGKKIGVAS